MSGSWLDTGDNKYTTTDTRARICLYTSSWDDVIDNGLGIGISVMYMRSDFFNTVRNRGEEVTITPARDAFREC